MTPLKLRIVVPARTDRRIASLLGAIEHEARLIGADVAAVPDVPPDDEGDEVYLLVPEELFPRTALAVPAPRRPGYGRPAPCPPRPDHPRAGPPGTRGTSGPAHAPATPGR